jgi:hypothetical protein
MGISYNPSIVSSGLVLCLDAANPRSYSGSGTTWTDLSGNGNNATKQGTAALATWNSAGYFEHRPANYFGAADAGSFAPDSGGCWWQVTHASSLSPNAGFWTVAGWVKVIGDQSGNGVGWFHKAGSPDERGIHLEPYAGEIRANGSSGWNAILYNINNSSVWANFCFVFTQTSGTYGTNSGNLKFYLNGSQAAENTAFTPVIDSGQPIYLGRRNGHFRHFINADIASYFYYTKSLTATEVLQNYNATRSRFGL